MKRASSIETKPSHAWALGKCCGGLIVALFACLLGAATPLIALMPQVVTFQGRIAVAGQPFAGAGQFKFAVLANNGALQVWNNDGSTNAEPAVWVNVPVSNGVFTVPLGDVSVPGMAALPPGLFRQFGDTRLRIWFNDGTNGFAQLAPDQKLTTAPYAFHAEHADTVPDGSINAAKLAQGAASGNLGSNSIAAWQLAPGAAAANLAPGSVSASHLAPDSALQNLAASGAGVVPSGGIVLSELEVNPQFLAAGFVPLGMSNVVTTNRWVSLPNGPPMAGAATQNAARYGHAAVWTTTEMLVYGGYPVRFGLRYHASSNTWNFITSSNAPEIDACVGFWTGSRFLVWDLNKGSGGRYNPATDSWQTIATANSPGPRSGANAVWTGTEMIIWGGNNNTGARYNPATDTWTPMSVNNAPSARRDAAAVWTGSRMIVFGGEASHLQFVESPCIGDGEVHLDVPDVFANGRAYNPANNTWTTIADAPEARTSHQAVWSGTEMLVYGGYDDASPACVPSGGGWGGVSFGPATVYAPAKRGLRYNFSNNTWSMMATNNQPNATAEFTLTWTGSEMILFGGANAFVAQARYNTVGNSWTAISTNGSLSNRDRHTAVWTGSQIILWGGEVGGGEKADGARYTPGGSWTMLPAVPAAFSEPGARSGAVSVWTGNEFIVWGGQTSEYQYLRSGGMFRPALGTWTNTPVGGSPSPRANATAVWTGTEMLVWGGNEYFTQQGTGARFNVASNTWTPISTVGAPRSRSGHVAVWTGTEMIVWGGYYMTNFFDYVFLNNGAIYNPSTDTWRPMTNNGLFLLGAAFQTATWTGTEMILVGGLSESGANLLYMNTIHRYNPATDTWTLGALLPMDHRRHSHSAVWTGTEVLVWGGRHTNYLNTGFRYNPVSNTWTDLPSTTASGRVSHTAVWTGQHMIIHGGESGAGKFGDTVIFEPIADRWTLEPWILHRTSHRAAWTGSEMIVATGKGFGDLDSTLAFRPAKILHYYQKQ